MQIIILYLTPLLEILLYRVNFWKINIYFFNYHIMYFMLNNGDRLLVNMIMLYHSRLNSNY